MKGISKQQKQEEVWDNLGRTTNLNPMAAALQYSYANLSLLFAHYHAKIIPWGHKTADFRVRNKSYTVEVYNKDTAMSFID